MPSQITSLEKILHVYLAKAEKHAKQAAIDKYAPLVEKEFRKTMATTLAKWSMSTDSRVNFTADDYQVVVTLSIPKEKLHMVDKGAVRDAVLGGRE